MCPDPCCYYVYIMASQTRVLYTGITNDLPRRVYQPKKGLIAGFTSDYHVTRLVFFERHLSSRAAVTRERQIKGWRRSKKLELIEQSNAGWIDLAADWFRE
jgi:putative endonuclease